MFIYVNKFTLLKFSGCRSSFSNGADVHVPWSTVPSMAPFMLDSNFTSCGITFHFFAILLSSLLFQLFIFVKCPVSSLLGGEEATQPHALLSL